MVAKAKPGDKRIGNQFWKFRTRSGPKKIFSDPKILWEECVKYFEWSEANPLMASEVVKFQGIATLTEVPKMRAMTIKGLCFYLKISYDAWVDYRTDKDLSNVIHEAEQIIYDQKFSGAAAEMLNANIIARDLGLVDKKEVKADVTTNMTMEEIDNQIKATEDRINAGINSSTK